MIQIEYQKPLEPLFKKLKVLALNNNGKLTGNYENGTFNVKSQIGIFQGNYFYKGNNICINITQKPFFISKRLIENEIKKYLSNN